MSLQPELLALLVCPACRNLLRLLQDETGLSCETCTVIYPVDDGIPVLLVEEAIAASEWPSRRTPATETDTAR